MGKESVYNEQLRTTLLRFAKRRLGCDAEDGVQDAMLAAFVKDAQEPMQYAFGVLKKRAARARRHPKRALLEEPRRLFPGSDALLSTAEDFGRLDAALETTLKWHHFPGRTDLIVPSFDAIDMLRVLTEFEATLAVFDLLPFSDRHQRRVRRGFEQDLAAAFNECRCEIDPERFRRREEPIDESEDDLEDEAASGGRKGVPVFYVADDHHLDGASVGPQVPVLEIIDGSLHRAYFATMHYGPKLPTRRILGIAVQAVSAATTP